MPIPGMPERQKMILDKREVDAIEVVRSFGPLCSRLAVRAATLLIAARHVHLLSVLSSLISLA